MLLNMNTKILFITSTRIGDAILSNGVLRHLLEKHPNSELTVVCGPLVQSFYEGVPNLHKIYPLKKKKWKKHWFELWKAIKGTRWDVVVDLRNSVVSRLISAENRYVFGPKVDQTAHKSVQNAQILGLDTPPETTMWFTGAQKKKAADLLQAGSPILGVGPTANWIGKTWPIENFISLIQRLRGDGQPFSGWRVAVFAAPGEEADAKRLLESLPDDIGIDVIAKGNPAEAAACLSRCAYYIGNDSGLMHAAAAAGVPTMGLFGASYASIYAPFGPKATYVHTPESYDELTSFDGYDPKTLDHSLLGSLTVDMVEEAVKTHFV